MNLYEIVIYIFVTLLKDVDTSLPVWRWRSRRVSRRSASLLSLAASRGKGLGPWYQLLRQPFGCGLLLVSHAFSNPWMFMGNNFLGTSR